MTSVQDTPGAPGRAAAATMQAVQLTAWQAAPELREVPRPVPGPGEVLLEVRAAGLCHSDLHLMHWPAGTVPYELPFTLGHEVAGTVAALGPGATGVDVGEPVLVYGPWGCGVCPRCSLGEEHLCLRASTLPGRGCGLGRDGGLAEYLTVPSPRLLVPLGDLDPAHAAPLADAALTPYHAIRRALPLLRPGSSAVVIGVGGLGHVAVQLLKALSPARVVAVDTRAEALELALRHGADAALPAAALPAPGLRAETGGDAATLPARELRAETGRHGATLPARELRAETGRHGATLVIDCVGVDTTLALAAETVAPGGHVAIVGLGGGTFPMRFGAVPMETPVVLSNWGTRAELAEVVALARAGAIHMEVERIPLSGALDAYQRLESGDVRGRLVVEP